MKTDALLATPASLDRRSTNFLGGSFLDINVYREVLQCEIPWVDPCSLEGSICRDGGDLDGSSGAGTGTGTGTDTDPSTTPTPSSPLCVARADPDQGDGTPWCQCDGSDVKYPTISGATGNICAYSTLPWTPTPTTTSTSYDPWPITVTEPYGDIIKCQTWGTLNVGGEVGQVSSYCSSSTSTIFTASTTSSAPATTTTSISYDWPGLSSCDNSCAEFGAEYILGTYTYYTALGAGWGYNTDQQAIIWDTTGNMVAVGLLHVDDISRLTNVCGIFTEKELYLYADGDGIKYLYLDGGWASCNAYDHYCSGTLLLDTASLHFTGCCKRTGDCPPTGCDAPCSG